MEVEARAVRIRRPLNSPRQFETATISGHGGKNGKVHVLFTVGEFKVILQIATSDVQGII
jgi:hypothetical protein